MQSICNNCGKSFFEAVMQTPIGSPRPLLFIQCSKCGRVFGVQEYEFNNSPIDYSKRFEQIDEAQKLTHTNLRVLNENIVSVLNIVNKL